MPDCPDETHSTGNPPLRFPVGSLVIANPTKWRSNAFDVWGRGLGVGLVVEPPFPLENDTVDVRWPAGRCFEETDQLLPAPRPTAETPASHLPPKPENLTP